MKTRNAGLLAATAAVAATLLGGSAASAQVMPNSFLATETGYGATLGAAEHNAQVQLTGDYSGCGAWWLDSDSQAPDGTWTATISANCSGIR